MTSFLFPIYVVLLFAAFQTIRKQVKELSLSFNGTTILLAVIGALLLDNLIITSGLPLREGRLLAAFNLGRWWLRILMMPMLIVTYVEMTGRLEIQAAKSRTIAGVVGGLALLLVIVQAWANAAVLQPDQLVPVQLVAGANWTIYAPAEHLLLPGTIAANTVGAAFGLLMLIRARWPWVLLAAAAVLIGSTLVSLPLFAANGLEVALVWTLVATESRAQREGLKLSRRDLETRLKGLG